MSERWRPTKEQLRAAYGRKVRDVIAPGLEVLFCGINPGLYSGAVGHHFARPGNRFWPALYRSGFTDTLLSPFDERRLLAFGLGITNLVDRATASADELSNDELRRGARRLRQKASRYSPRFVALCGLSAYRAAFERRNAQVGAQEEKLDGARVWLLPNPSGLNAHYRAEDLARLFGTLRSVAERDH